MAVQNKILQKDSDQLQVERKRLTETTIELTRAKEKEEQTNANFKAI